MPFTFSHPAIVLPLTTLPRKWVSTTGLVIGSMAPDFEKFFKMAPGNTVSHTWEGIFWFNLPLGVVLAFLFHGVVRDPLIQNLPLPFRRRLLPFTGFNWKSYFKRNYLVVMLSVLVGATSHLCWDSITHTRGLGVQLFPFLLREVAIGNMAVPLYQLLDIVGSVLGILFILGVVMSLPNTIKSKSVPSPDTWRMYWPVVITFSILVVTARVGFLNMDREAIWSLLITSISATMVGIIISSFIVKSSVIK
ncbi:DUF4184 family protein [Pontibacter sp. MBLB2868]|uniref:DUF4184 family protein n=1 Tax=Pontibacter sp. MBLB2868 TaxID=3451555 RepID=UPI003F74FEE9